MLTHTGERPHQCEKCRKAFARLHNLKCHMLTHTGERPHQCEQCRYKFVQLGDLKVHMLTHSKKKMYKYFYQRSFKHLLSLKAHSRIHTDEKFRCINFGCNRSFLYKRSLDYHLTLHVLKGFSAFSPGYF